MIKCKVKQISNHFFAVLLLSGDKRKPDVGAYTDECQVLCYITVYKDLYSALWQMENIIYTSYLTK